jgi:hypothetical protein
MQGSGEKELNLLQGIPYEYESLKIVSFKYAAIVFPPLRFG